MNRHIKVRLLHLMLAMGLALSITPGVMARPLSGTLPTIKEPPSARFNITGSINSSDLKNGGLSVGLSGDGALSNGRLPENISVSFSGNLPSGSPNQTTTNVVYADGKYYFKTSGLSTQGESQWYVMDLSMLPGGGMSMNSGSLVGVDPKYADALQSQEVGKETLNGAATTKYQVDVDLQKLYSMMGMAGSTSQLGKDSKMTLYMWVGDNDQYLYQERMVFDARVASPQSDTGGETSITLDLTITFKDFGAPITIDVPANATPLDLSSSGSSAMPGGMPTSLSLLSYIGGAPSTNMPTGMPRTGASNSNSGLPLVVIAAALLCLALGGALRRLALLR